jgi:Zn-dependent oligopeptidase
MTLGHDSYRRAAQVELANSSSAALDVAQYFPLDRCIRGLVQLSQSLFGVKVVVDTAPSAETWAANITRLTLHHPDEVLLVPKPLL